MLFELRTRRCVGAIYVHALPCKGAQDQHIESMTSKESMTSLNKKTYVDKI